MPLRERVYKVGLIFLQNGGFDVTVGKFDAKTLERYGNDVIIEKKNHGRKVWIQRHAVFLKETPTRPSFNNHAPKKIKLLKYRVLKA